MLQKACRVSGEASRRWQGELLGALTMRYFTQVEILEQVGRRRLAKFLEPFQPELKANNLVLPNGAGEDSSYFSELAAALARPESLPENLRKALFTLEAAASLENNNRLWTAIERRIPCVSVSIDCPLDRALGLWFLAPDEFAQFADTNRRAATNVENGNPRTSATSAFSPQPSALSEAD